MHLFSTVRGRLVELAVLGGSVAGPAVVAAQTAPLPCRLLRLAPAERVQAAMLIIEAEVLDSQGKWRDAQQHIFTRQRLLVFRVLKGALPDAAALPLLLEVARRASPDKS